MTDELSVGSLSLVAFFFENGKLLRHLNCKSKKIKVLWGGRPARGEYTI